MRSLIVYYSKTGVTRRAAIDVSRMLGSDVEEIIDIKDRGGLAGWLTGGGDSFLKKLTEIKRPKKDPSKYSLVIIGTPVWSFTVTPAIRTYITKKCRRLRKVAFFCTHGGAPGNTFKTMKELCGKKPVAILGLTAKDMQSGESFDKIKKFVSKIRNS